MPLALHGFSSWAWGSLCLTHLMRRQRINCLKQDQSPSLATLSRLYPHFQTTSCLPGAPCCLLRPVTSLALWVTLRRKPGVRSYFCMELLLHGATNGKQNVPFEKTNSQLICVIPVIFVSSLYPWYSKGGLFASHLSITWELVRNAASLWPPQTSQIRSCVLTRSPGDSYAH